MQTVIYIDVLVFINSIITFLILMTTSDIVKRYADSKHYVAGSFAGGLLSIAILLPEINLLLSVLLKASEAALIVRIAFGYGNIRRYAKAALSFVIVSLLYGGIIFSVNCLFLSDRIYGNNGYYYIDFSSTGLIIICFSVFVALRIIDRRFFRKHKTEIIYDIELFFSDRKVSCKALYDSGNSVRDRFTGKPVIIVSFSVLEGLFNGNEAQLINSILDGIIPTELPERIRLLPVRTLGNYRLLPAYSADKAVISNEDFSKTVLNPSIALSDDSFGGRKYSALINSDITGEVLV